ncbi:MAG: nitroreductase family protein [Vicinamibacterales bacterium]
MPADGGVDAGIAEVLAYHDRTKHHVHRFAASTGYLDWATQPDPFRRYAGTPVLALPHEGAVQGVGFDDLPAPLAAPLTLGTTGEFLRCSLGLSAWKQYGSARWALRVNPSSGNLHPTEGYVVAPTLSGEGWSVYHYAPREHALEVRAHLGPVASTAAPAGVSLDGVIPDGVMLVALTSIHWREAWKYGERAFRYCQHDVGHAVAALRYAAALLGWRLRVLPDWSDADLSTLLGVDREVPDGVEREHPDCVMAVGPGDVAAVGGPESWLVPAARAVWTGVPNQLSPGHADWPAIDRVAEASRRAERHPAERRRAEKPCANRAVGLAPAVEAAGLESASAARPAIAMLAPAVRASGAADARALLLQRRSAVAFDGQGELSRAAFATMVRRVAPRCAIPAGPDVVPDVVPLPWDALPWSPQVHLVWFIHRVEGVTPGLYAQVRDPTALTELRAGLRGDMLWEPVDGLEGLYLLAPLDARSLARRLSCDQDIAADGYFGMAMLARVEPSLRMFGPWFYRHLYWECGMVGQVLYLEAEAAGARATGIGCYYDDAVHDLLGIQGHHWQSLYHFSMGRPVEDARLTTEPGYGWESGAV